MRSPILILFLLFFLFILGCTAENKPANKGNTVTEVVCNPPYIQSEMHCCLDTNKNNLCDTQETAISNPPSKTEPVNEPVPHVSQPVIQPAPSTTNPLSTSNNEFDTSTALSSWNIGYESGSRIEITNGHLTIIPPRSAWYRDGTAPFVYQNINGNFVVETQVNAHRIGDSSHAATGQYTSGGFVVRDPGSSSGKENWIMYNTGNQGSPAPSTVGTERKTTVNSNSILHVRPGTFTGLLRVCRLGNIFHMFRWLTGESGWSEEPESFTRNDLPSEVQVGLVANAFAPPVDVQVDFDYIHFGVPSSLQDCTKQLS